MFLSNFDLLYISARERKNESAVKQFEHAPVTYQVKPQKFYTDEKLVLIKFSPFLAPFVTFSVKF